MVLRSKGNNSDIPVSYKYLQLLLDHLPAAKPRNIEKWARPILKKAGIRDTANESYAYGLAREFRERAAPFTSSGEELATKQQEDGRMITVEVNRYERNASNRKACIAHWDAICWICGFGSAKVYRDVRDRFIHVHHLEPVSKGKRRIDPKKDLIPVCPNCHAMLHAQRELMSPGELKKRLLRTYQDIRTA